ncbi:hypothetical protein QUA74_21500 [Microcoleus sp. LAD1_D3]
MKIDPTIYFRYWAIDHPIPKTIKEYKCLQSSGQQSIDTELSPSFGVGLSNILW